MRWSVVRVHRMTILYGTPTDPQAFKSYYYDTHIPLARKMRGLTRWNLSWIESDPDGICAHASAIDGGSVVKVPAY